MRAACVSAGGRDYRVARTTGVRRTATRHRRSGRHPGHV